MRQKFANDELQFVKKRWELCTLIYSILTIFLLLFYWTGGDSGKIIETLLAIGDVFFVLVIFSILGRKWIRVHHYSLPAIVLVRCATAIIQLQMMLNNVEPLSNKFDYYSW